MNFKDWLDEIENEPTTFQMEVDKGLFITIRVPKSADELARLEKGAESFASAVVSNPPREWAALKPSTTSAARMAYLFQQLCVDPPDVSVPDVLRLVKYKGLMVIAAVSEAYRRAGGMIAEKEVEDIQRVGESLDETT